MYTVIFILLLGIGGALLYSTASSKWKIHWDKERLDFKTAFLLQQLPEQSVEKLPNILFIVADDLNLLPYLSGSLKGGLA